MRRSSVTYPRTSSRYIPEDVFDEVPALFDRLAGHSSFAEKIADMGELNRRSVDASKVTDHHALLVTPNRRWLFTRTSSSSTT